MPVKNKLLQFSNKYAITSSAPMQVHPKLFVSGLNNCSGNLARESNAAVVHCCQQPCYVRTVGDDAGISVEYKGDLFLNMADPVTPMFKPEMFLRFMQFMRLHADDSVMIHCNLGQSRSPSMAMLWMAKGLGVIPNESYDAAVRAFKPLYPYFKPGRGISLYMREHWSEL